MSGWFFLSSCSRIKLHQSSVATQLPRVFALHTNMVQCSSVSQRGHLQVQLLKQLYPIFWLLLIFPLFFSGLFSPVLQSLGQVSWRQVWSVWRCSRRGKRQLYTNCVNVVVYDIRGVGGEDWQCSVIYDVWMRDKGEGKLSFVGAHCHIQTSRNTFSTPSVMVFCFVLLIIRQRDWTWYSQTLMILDLLFWQETPHFSRRRKRRRSHKQQLFSAAGIKSAPNALAECTNFHSLLKEVITVILFCSFSAGCFSLLACRSVSDENLLPFSSNAKHSHLSIRFNSEVLFFHDWGASFIRISVLVKTGGLCLVYVRIGVLDV